MQQEGKWCLEKEKGRQVLVSKVLNTYIHADGVGEIE